MTRKKSSALFVDAATFVVSAMTLKTLRAKKRRSDALSTLQTDYTEGSRPAHVHLCPAEADKDRQPHEWTCNSPYCNEGGKRRCPAHGGEKPIQEGLEPWRGR